MYYKSMKQYHLHGAPPLDLENCPSIHWSGSVKGMKKLGFWPKEADVLRHGGYIYCLPVSR